MAFVVHVETVVDGVVLQLGDIAGDIDRCHPGNESRRGHTATAVPATTVAG
jgi:hypothetical protein